MARARCWLHIGGIVGALFVSGILSPAGAGEPLEMDEMVVVATLHERELFDAPYTSYFLSNDDLRLRLQPKALPDALEAVPGVLVQKTGHGMSSPFLRGVTAQRVVLIADGVRVNNVILREGPNQYWNTVDGMFYDNLEVLMGPGSVLYGSDAIGGVVYARSAPQQRGAEDGGFQWQGGEAYFRWASAERSFSEYLGGAFALDDDLSLKLGLSRQDFGELRSGDSTDHPGTDYEQWGGNVRLRWWIDGNSSIVAGYDHYDQDNVDRVHKTVDYVSFHGLAAGKDDRRVYDHDRRAAFVRYEFRDGQGWLEQADLGFSYQNMLENYFADRTTDKNRLEYRTTRDETYGVNLRLQSPSPVGTWTYGVDYYHDIVNSWGDNVNATTGVVTPREQGQVADDASHDLFGAYIQNELPIGDQLELITGLRYTYADMEADKVAFDTGLDSLSGHWDALTGSARLCWRPLESDNLRLFAGVSQGFRAPNLSDATRDDEFGGGDEKPTADLDEERFTSYEVGLKARGERGNLCVTGYIVDIRDRIGRLKYVNGAKVASKRNMDSGRIHGVEASANLRVSDAVSLFGSVAWQYGCEDNYYDRDAAFPGETLPLSRIMPLTGNVGVRWAPEESRWWAEFTVDMADKQDRLTDAEKDDNRFPEGGTPGYAVCHIRGGCRVTENVDVTVAVENLADKDYRIHGSGVNEPGRSVVIATRATF